MRRHWEEINFQEVQRARSNYRKPPAGNRNATVPSWEKKFCLSVGSVPWFRLVETKKIMYLYENVVTWNDSAGEDAFNNAKCRFWAEMHGFPCDIPLPDPDENIDEIDWNSSIDQELLLDLEREPVYPVAQDKAENVVILSSDLLNSQSFSCTGWGDAEEAFKKHTNAGTGHGIAANANDQNNPWEPKVAYDSSTLKPSGWDVGDDSGPLQPDGWGASQASGWVADGWGTNDAWEQDGRGNACGSGMLEQNGWGDTQGSGAFEQDGWGIGSAVQQDGWGIAPGGGASEQDRWGNCTKSSAGLSSWDTAGAYASHGWESSKGRGGDWSTRDRDSGTRVDTSWHTQKHKSSKFYAIDGHMDRGWRNGSRWRKRVNIVY